MKKIESDKMTFEDWITTQSGQEYWIKWEFTPEHGDLWHTPFVEDEVEILEVNGVKGVMINSNRLRSFEALCFDKMKEYQDEAQIARYEEA